MVSDLTEELEAEQQYLDAVDKRPRDGLQPELEPSPAPQPDYPAQDNTETDKEFYAGLRSLVGKTILWCGQSENRVVVVLTDDLTGIAINRETDQVGFVSDGSTFAQAMITPELERAKGILALKEIIDARTKEQQAEKPSESEDPRPEPTNPEEDIDVRPDARPEEVVESEDPGEPDGAREPQDLAETRDPAPRDLGGQATPPEEDRQDPGGRTDEIR